MNFYGDKIDITNELNSGAYELIDSLEMIKFINHKAKITEAEKSKVYKQLQFDKVVLSIKSIEYYYSYIIDKDVVDVFIIKMANKNYFIRKSRGELIFPIETEDVWVQ